MRASAITAVILGAVASASASTLLARQDSYPTCALSCIASPDLGSCSSISDTKCLCTSEAFVAGMTKCINTSCTGQELQAALTFARELCLQAGVTLPADGASTSAAASSSAPASSASASASGSKTGSAPVTSATAPGSASASASASQSGSAAASSSPAPTAASAATSHQANAILGLFAAGLAFFAL